MKKIYVFTVAVLFTMALNAQYLDITSIIFTKAGGSPSAPLPSKDLTPGDTVTMWFIFTNNLSGSQDLKKGDSLTFGWSIGGSDQGALIMSSLGSDLTNGSTLNAYLRNNYVLPKTEGFDLKICTWPLYNPYAPNTDPTKGGHCADFKGKSTSSLDGLNKDARSFNSVNHSLNYQFGLEYETNKIELFNLTGKMVGQYFVGQSGSIELNVNLNSGIYILKSEASDGISTEKVYIQ